VPTVSAEFSRLCKRLTIAITVAVLAPLATAVVLGSAQAVADPAPQPSVAVTVSHQTASLDTLGRARAVSWISSGHLSH
jgi:FlaG/FlaF family flagellin (archaellin)